MEEILKKLLKGENIFDVTIDNQKRKGKILQLDLEGSKALVRLDEPIKRMVTRFDPAPFANEPDETISVQKEELIYQDWLTIEG